MLEIIIKISSSFFFFFFFGQSAFIESLDSQICAEKTHLKKISGKITNDFFFVFFLGGGGGGVVQYEGWIRVFGKDGIF